MAAIPVRPPHLQSLYTEYRLLLGEYCQRRGYAPSLRDKLVRDVTPRMTMAEEELECAEPYRKAFPGRATPMGEPLRSPHYENWKRTRCFRWYYYDHIIEARRAIKRKLEEDPECQPYIRPSPARIRELFPVGTKGQPPTMFRWSGYQPPPGVPGLNPRTGKIARMSGFGALPSPEANYVAAFALAAVATYVAVGAVL